jgi:hypothetical protein
MVRSDPKPGLLYPLVEPSAACLFSACGCAGINGPSGFNSCGGDSVFNDFSAVIGVAGLLGGRSELLQPLIVAMPIAMAADVIDTQVIR